MILKKTALCIVAVIILCLFFTGYKYEKSVSENTKIRIIDRNGKHIDISKEDIEISKKIPGYEYESAIKDTVTDFIRLYNTSYYSKLDSYISLKEILTEECYSRISEDIRNNSKTDYQNKKINDIEIYGYLYNDIDNEATISARVKSDSLNKNEIAEYTFIFIFDNRWKISMVSSVLIK